MAAIARIFNIDFAALPVAVLNTISIWNKRVEARQQLAELSARDIADIGIDPAEIEREIAKPFWRA